MFNKLIKITIIAAMAAGFTSGQALAKANILMGKRLFNSYCAVCHGTNGKGAGPLAEKLKTENPPADLTGDKYQSKSVDELLKLVQGYNRSDSAMPKWENVIPEGNMRSLAEYVLSLTQTDVRLRGDERQGREIFRLSCVACHGPQGNGAGVLAKLLNVKMINYRTKPLTSISDTELIQIITKGKGEFMPMWEGTLASEEIKDVAAYVRSLYQK
ncbi:MAG: c-type cytochrome [Nitrospinota bacterium]|nr:c-type cytochrome [Nitrospinota bacterium]